VAISFAGVNSVLDRTLFTKKGPIVKRPIPVLAGTNLTVLNSNTVRVQSGSFNSSHIGFLLSIYGSPNSRNNGVFNIEDVIDSSTLRIDASLDNANYDETDSRIILLANDLRENYNSHVQTIDPVHGVSDSSNAITAKVSTSLNGAIKIINEFKQVFPLHISSFTGVPPVHLNDDTTNPIFGLDATNTQQALLLINELRARFESHRQNRDFHTEGDSVNRISVPRIYASIGSGPFVGPFNWQVSDPRYGQVADDTSDVDVKVNGFPSGIEAVFGLLGAVVLSNKPSNLDSVEIDYDYLKNLPTRIASLNTFEYVLNQDGNTNFSGLPGNKYKARSFLPNDNKTVGSAFSPQKTDWKYKGYERKYCAVLNDPNSLLLNVPTNRISYPVFEKSVGETVIRYDPTSLPNLSSDPWQLKGLPSASIANNQLVIADSSSEIGADSEPPFYSKSIDLQFESLTFSAFRSSIDEEELTLEGDFTGVAFGLSDGYKTSLVGFLLTEATGLSSSIWVANNLLSSYNAHLVQIGVHRPDDTVNSLAISSSKDLPSLIFLLTHLKAKYNAHVTSGPDSVHQYLNSGDVCTVPDPIDLDQCIELVNDLKQKFNSHLLGTLVHYVIDNTNIISKVKQAGILTSRGLSQYSSSWELAQIDWTLDSTYRLTRFPDGSVSLYFGGNPEPSCSVDHSDLPSTSGVDFRIDQMQQTFFGAIGAASTSKSKWSFIRVDINPLVQLQKGKNKSVDYVPTVVPELDPVAPWISLGHSGQERVYLSNLISDSYSYTDTENIERLGQTTGGFRGYIRLEPSLSKFTICATEFTASLSHWTFSVDSRSCGVFIEDGFISTRFLFIQASPSSASVTGTSQQPFSISANDILTLSFADQNPTSVVFPTAESSASNIVSVINSSLGFNFASVYVSPTGSTYVRLTDQVSGAASKFTIVGGNAAIKLGLQVGTYFGSDSNQEPRVVWFGEDLPNQDFPLWVSSGDQKVDLLNRLLRISDTSNSDYKAYGIFDPVYTSSSISPSIDWKLSFGVSILSFVAGDPVQSGSNLYFCGVLVNADEGPSGKNIEIHLSKGVGNSYFVCAYSYNPSTGFLDSISEFPFFWQDGKSHIYDVYVNKPSDLVMVLADGNSLGTFPYSSLNQGVIPSSISFGSGSNPVSNADLRTCKSTTDWTHIAIFRDSNTSNPLAPSRRYVGLYAGGDPSKLSSYYLHQIDWTVPHTYRLVRDPITNVSVYIDGSDIPSISVGYDSIKLPPSSESFLNSFTEKRPSISFGSFSPYDVIRSRWVSFSYSIGSLTLSDNIIPQNNVLNQHNVIASPEHLITKEPHEHYGFSVWSGGTPSDDFMGDESIGAFTVLNEGTVPVPMTQDLNFRGGLIKFVTKTSSIGIGDFVDQDAYLSSYENDPFDAVSITSWSTFVTNFVARVNLLKSLYESHRVDTSYHLIPDVVNTIITPDAFDVDSAVYLVNDIRSRFNSHLIESGIHVNDDTINSPVLPSASDISEAIVLSEHLIDSMIRGSSEYSHTGHFVSSNFHPVDDNVDIITGPNASNLDQAIQILNDIKTNYNLHRLASGAHSPNDTTNIVTAPAAVDLATAHALALDIVSQYNAHISTGPIFVHKNVDSISTMPAVGSVTEQNVINFSNTARELYNYHITSITFHYSISTAISVACTSPDIDQLSLTISSLNEIRSAYNIHVASTDLHIGVSGTEILTSPIASDLATSITLANEILSKYDIHRVAASRHLLDDQDNYISMTPCVDLITLVQLSQSIMTNYWSHLIHKGSHGLDDTSNTVTSPVATDLTSVIILLNEIRTKYELHRVRTQSHYFIDTIHIISAPACSNLSTALQLYNDVSGNFSAHVVSNFHVAADIQSQVQASASDLATLISAVNSLRSSYNAHMSRVVSGVHTHGRNDSTIPITSSPASQCAEFLNKFTSGFSAHKSRIGIHKIVDKWSSYAAKIPVSSNPPKIDLNSLYLYSNLALNAFNKHLNGESDGTIPVRIHNTWDEVNVQTVYDFEFISDVCDSINNLKNGYNDHIHGISFHLIPDVSNSPSLSETPNPVLELSNFSISAKDWFNNHAVSTQSHVNIQKNLQVSLSNPDTDGSLSSLEEVSLILNKLKLNYNGHRDSENIHVTDDTTNIVTSPDSTTSNIQTITDLASDISSVFSFHGVYPGVHGSSVFIKLVEPSGVLYDSMKFFTNIDGEPGYWAPFSDDE